MNLFKDVFVSNLVDDGMYVNEDLTEKRNKKERETSEFGKKEGIKDIDVYRDNISGAGYSNSNFTTQEQTKNIDQLMRLYETVSQLSLPCDSINEINNEAIIVNERDRVSIDFEDYKKEVDETLKEKITDEFNQILDVMNFDDEAHSWFRQWYIQGRLLVQCVIDEKNPKAGVLKYKIMSPYNLKRYYSEKDHKYYYVYRQDEKQDSIYNIDDDKVGNKIPDELIIFAPSGLYLSYEKQIPISYLHTAIKSIQRLDILEDHILIYRISRAPERRVFYIDPGDIPPKKAELYLQKIISKYKQKHVWDASNSSLTSKSKHPSMVEDFFLLRRNGKNTEIDTLPSGGALSDIEDLHYFKRDAVRSLKVPFSRLNYEDRQNNVTYNNDITREEVQFNNFIKFLTSKFAVVLKLALKKQLVLKGIIAEENWSMISRKLIINFKQNSEYNDLLKLQNLEMRLSLLRDANDAKDDGYLSKLYIQKNVLGFSDEQIKEIKRERQQENT